MQRHAGLPRAGADLADELALERLLVGASLAGDHEVGSLERLGQADQLGHDLDPGADGRVRKADEARGRSPGRTGAGKVGHQPPGRLFDGVAVRLQRGVECGDRRLVGALLRAVGGRGAARPAQRVRDIRGDDELHVGQPRVQAGRVDALQPRQRRAPLGKVATIADERRPQRTQQAAAAIGGRRSAEPDGDALDTRVQRGANEVARAASRGQPGVLRRSLVGRQARQPRGGRQLDERVPAVVEQQPVGADRPSQRVGRLGRPALRGLAERIGHRRQGPLAAIRHRPAEDLVTRPDLGPARRDGRGHADGVQRSAEGVGRDNDTQRVAHRSLSVLRLSR